jgi:hypothetical protein
MLSKLLSKFFPSGAKTSDSDHTDVSRRASKRAKALLALHRTKKYTHSSFSTKYAALESFECIAPNIAVFTQLIEKHYDNVVSGASIPRSDIFAAPSSVTLEQFFIDERGRYINKSMFHRFHIGAVGLCEATEGFEAYEFGTQEYNLRVLTRCFKSIEDFCGAVEGAAEK